MAKFRIATPAGASFTVAGGDYGYEMEALTPLGAEIVEITAKGSRRVRGRRPRRRRALRQGPADHEADHRRPWSAAGSSRSAVSASTRSTSPPPPPRASRSPTCPDTFIEEVADHAMMLILATLPAARRAGPTLREGRWAEGRPHAAEDPAADAA